MNIAIVQTKPRKGDRAANLIAFGDACAQLLESGAPDLVVLPEAAFTGYFLEGAVYEHARDAATIAREVATVWRDVGGGPVDLAFGFYENAFGTYYNASMYVRVEAGTERVLHVHRKLFLPTYGVFDESRFLSRGRSLAAFDTEHGRAAMLICEDAWHAIAPTIAALKGARLLVIPSASPGRGLAGTGGELENVVRWRETLRNIASEHGVFIAYAGLAGFEGGKGMTGSSCIVDPTGEIVVQAPAIDAALVRAEIDLRDVDVARAHLPLLGDLASVLPDLLLDPDLPLPGGGAKVRA